MRPIWLSVFFLIFYNEPELGAKIFPAMALTPLPSNIGQGSNPQSYDCEPSALPLDHSFCCNNIAENQSKFQKTKNGFDELARHYEERSLDI